LSPAGEAKQRGCLSEVLERDAERSEALNDGAEGGFIPTETPSTHQP